MEKICAGIDLGTTNSCIAILEAGRPVVIPNELGEPTTSSLVSVLPDGNILVGRKARSRLLTHPADTFASIKRRMGDATRSVMGRGIFSRIRLGLDPRSPQKLCRAPSWRSAGKRCNYGTRELQQRAAAGD